jgi:hypothetical protein
MPKARWILHSGREWRLTDLASQYHLRPQTLAARLDRGYPVERALATGLCSRSEAGQRAAAIWRLGR